MYLARATFAQPLRDVAKVLRSSQVHYNWISGSNNAPNIIYTQYHSWSVWTPTTVLQWHPWHLATPHDLCPTSERGCHGVGSTPGTIQCDLNEKTTGNIRLPCGVFFSILRLSGVFNSTRDCPGGKQEFVGGLQRIWRWFQPLFSA